MTLRVAYTLEQCWHRVPGGTASSALGVAQAINTAHRDVTLLGVSARHDAPPPDAFAPPVPVHGLPLPRRALYEAWHVLHWPRVQRAVGDVEVIHATGMAIPPKSAPLIVTVHDLAFLHYPKHATRNGRRFFHQSLHLTKRHADLVLCPSNATRRDCIDAGLDGGRVQVVPWGTDAVDAASLATGADAANAAVLARHGLDARRYVLFVGTIEPRKNLARLAAAVSTLDPSITLALVGPHGWNEDLAAIVGSQQSRVRTLGFVPRNELDVLYANAAVFCYPSLFEGFGMPVLEAMAAGAAVITSAGTATEEVAGDAAVLVDPLDTDALAAALARVIDDATFAADLRARAIARASTFSWSRAADLTVAAYREVLAR